MGTVKLGYSAKGAGLITAPLFLVRYVPELWLSLRVPGLAMTCCEGLGAEVWDVPIGSGTLWSSLVQGSSDSTVASSSLGSITLISVFARRRWRLFRRRADPDWVFTSYERGPSRAAYRTWEPFLRCLVQCTHRLPSCQGTKISCTPIMVVLHSLLAFLVRYLIYHRDGQAWLELTLVK